MFLVAFSFMFLSGCLTLHTRNELKTQLKGGVHCCDKEFARELFCLKYYGHCVC